MPRPDKVAVVEATKEAAQKASSIVLADFSGINVERDTQLRRRMREEAIEYRVVKNRLAKISFAELGYNELLEHFTGPTSIAFGYEDPAAPVRVILEAAKKTDIPKIKAIFFEGRLFSAADAQKIVSLPTREVLLTRMVGGLNAPIANLVGNLNGILQKFVATLSAVRQRKEQDQ